MHIQPAAARRVLFTGLLCLIGPLSFGHAVHRAPRLWLAMAAGVAIIAALLRLERGVARRGGMPPIDLALLCDAAFMRGLCAAFFFANLSFYLVMTMFMQRGLLMAPPRARGLAVLVHTVTWSGTPATPLLVLMLAIFGYGEDW